MARRRSEWLRSRRPGPASKRHARCAAVHEEALEIRRRAAARDDHGQAPFVWRREEEDGPSTRTSPAQRAQQSGGEFPPADKATRTDHEAVQISWTGATISIGSRSGIEFSSTFPIPKPSPPSAAELRASAPLGFGARSPRQALRPDLTSDKNRLPSAQRTLKLTMPGNDLADANRQRDEHRRAKPADSLAPPTREMA